jgi:twitching motility two-component system response regulator PilH
MNGVISDILKMARILIIDDSPTEIFALRRMLEAAGYEVISASSAELGLSKARQEKPNLILMDVVMPGMNGFQATRRLVKNPDTANIPIIVVTTKNLEIDRIWALRQGARDYIVKPPVQSELLAKIKILLED